MKETKTSSGLSMGSLLQVAFIVLKMCGIINWSWWWVLAPTWVTFALIVLVAIVQIAMIWVE